MPDEPKAISAASPVRGRYDQEIDRESAYELLQKKAEAPSAAPRGGSVPRSGPWEQQAPAEPAPPPRERAPAREREPAPARTSSRPSATERAITNFASSAARSIGTQVGRAILRSIMGNMKR